MKIWQSYSYKEKNKGLIAGYAIFFVLVYWLALHPSIQLYFQNTGMEAKIQQAQDAPLQIQRLKARLASSEQKTMNGFAGESLQKELFAKVGKICQQEQVRLRLLEHVDKQKMGEMEIDTYQMVLEGDFHSLVKALHQVENTLGHGVVSSAGWGKEMDRRSKENRLIETIYLQSIRID
jgi:hypothetical protein